MSLNPSQSKGIQVVLPAVFDSLESLNIGLLNEPCFVTKAHIRVG